MILNFVHPIIFMKFTKLSVSVVVLFLRLDPEEHDKITAEGMMRFLEDLQLNPESRVVLVLAWKFKAATQCEFTKEEFVNGMADLG